MFVLGQEVIPFQWNTGRECGSHQVGGNGSGVLYWVVASRGVDCAICFDTRNSCVNRDRLINNSGCSEVGAVEADQSSLEAGFPERKMAFSMHLGARVRTGVNMPDSQLIAASIVLYFPRIAAMGGNSGNIFFSSEFLVTVGVGTWRQDPCQMTGMRAMM
jgi:hypothetical protein